MIPLGSCTIKLNAASELIPFRIPLSQSSPLCPVSQAQGYWEIFKDLGNTCVVYGLCRNFPTTQFWSSRRICGLMIIKAYHESRGDHQRKIMIIPSSAHGTNLHLCYGRFQVVVTGCDENGNINVDELKKVAEENKDTLGGLMVTYPSTHGVFEEAIKEITGIIHENGGQVYMDGANMNAQVGSQAQEILVLMYVTICTKHCYSSRRRRSRNGPNWCCCSSCAIPSRKFLIESGGEKALICISATPFGSSLILLISYGYIKMLGAKGLKESTEMAILNANYIAKKLENHYPILYKGKNDTVAHEMILDCREFRKPQR